jgi:predicted anti-sigma-YlaC factor YlaD
MNCQSAREALLVADLDDLRGEIASSPLARHLEGCDACRSIARAMGAELDGFAQMARERTARRTRRIALLAGLPIAAAIVGLAVLLPAKDEPAGPDSVNVHPANVVSVEVARGQQATVFKTKDPKVTVVWLTPGGGDVNP